jgi:hypothetical protein
MRSHRDLNGLARSPSNNYLKHPVRILTAEPTHRSPACAR